MEMFPILGNQTITLTLQSESIIKALKEIERQKHVKRTHSNTSDKERMKIDVHEKGITMKIKAEEDELNKALDANEKS